MIGRPPSNLFSSGAVVATPACWQALEKANQSISVFLSRHLTGDWGDLDDEDKLSNDDAIRDGGRILSAYVLATGQRIWLITEAADENGKRVATTALLPEEY